ncbi:MAG: hypothetical protein WCJ70_03020 [bacterium]
MSHLEFSASKNTLNGQRASAQYLAQLQSLAHQQAYSDPACSISLPHDSTHLHNARVLCDSIVGEAKLKYVVVVGIGGSNLGTQAVYDALRGLADSYPTSDDAPRLICLDTVHSATLTHVRQHLLSHTSRPEEVVICVISKSGNTTETIANANILITGLEQQYPSISSRVVAITDPNSPLEKIAIEKGFRVLHMPPLVGGRYSVFSAVGIFPLMCLGIDVNALLAGAQYAIEDMKNADTSISVGCANDLLGALSGGLVIHDLFLFDPRLETMGKWYRQLCAESLGKDGKGILPTVSIGSTDLHSVAQLYLGGLNNRFTSFVWADQEQDEALAIQPGIDLVTNIGGKKIADIYHAIFSGTVEAYKKTERLYNTFHFDALNEWHLGAWMQSQMICTMLVGHAMGINPFDQPQVEIYKKATRTVLQQS